MHNEITKNEFSKRDGENDSRAEKHQEMHVSGPWVSNVCTKSTHTSRAGNCRRSREASVPGGEMVKAKGKRTLERKLMTQRLC